MSKSEVKIKDLPELVVPSVLSGSVVPNAEPKLPEVIRERVNPKAVEQDIQIKETSLIPNPLEFIKEVGKGLYKAAGYLPYIPESVTYLVLNTATILFTTEETRGRWINNIRDFCNKYVPGGSLLGDDKVFAHSSDAELRDKLNPLVNISKAVVEPLTTPLHLIGEGLTDRVTFAVYNAFLADKAVSFESFLKEAENEKNWHLRLGRTAVYTVEAVALAYVCGGVGAATKLEAAANTLRFLGMPTVMTTLSAVGNILGREDFNKSSYKELAFEFITQIPEGVFQSGMFMLPISKLSQWRISQGVSKLNAQHGISSVNSKDGLKLPSSLSQYQRDVNLLVDRTRMWGELLDMAEGMPDAFSSGMELKDRAISFILDPFNKDNLRLLFSSGAKFGSAAMDLVDVKSNQRHNESLREVADRGQKAVDTNLKGSVVELDSSDIKEYYREYMYRVKDSSPNSFSEKYLGIKLSSNKALRAEIAERAESVEAFYDGERDVIFVPKLRADATLLQLDYRL